MIRLSLLLLLTSSLFVEALPLQILAGRPRQAAAGGGPSYIFQESFEGTGYENSWTEDLGTPNEDDTTPTPLHGSQSLSVSQDHRITCNTTFSAMTTCYIYFEIIHNTTDATDFVIQWRNGTTDIVNVQRNSDDTYRVYHGSAFNNTVATFAVDTWISVWLHYTAGSGANGTLDAYMSTTRTKPGSPTVSVTTGTATLGITQPYVRNDSAINYNLDHLLVDDVAIGSNP